MKKLVSLLLALVMVVSLFAGCKGNEANNSQENNSQNEKNEDSNNNSSSKNANSENDEEVSNFNETGLPIVNDPVTISLAARLSADAINFNEMEYFKMLEKDTNIKTKWNLIDADSWNEKFSLMINSNELPEIIYGVHTMSAADSVKYGVQGLYLELTDLINKYGEHINPIVAKYPEYLAQVKSMDGKIYALPAFSAERPVAPVAQFINQKWLNQLGLEMPTTIDELTTVLKAFKDGGDLNGDGKNNDYAMAFQFASWCCIETMFGAFGLPTRANTYMQQVDGEIVYVPTDDSFKEGIKWLNELYEYGCINPESFTFNGADYTALKNGDTTGVVSTWTVPIDGDPYVTLPQVSGPNGDKYHYYAKYLQLYGPGMVITKDCENPEIAMRWADYQYEQDIAFQAFQGIYGSTAEKLDDGTVRYFETEEYPDGKDFEILRNSTAPGRSAIAALTPEKWETCKLASDITLKYDVDDIYRQQGALDDKVTALPPLMFTEEEQEVITDASTELKDYVNTITAKWITQGGIDDEWDEYIKTLEKIGVKEYEAVYQAGFDRFLGK